MCERNAPRILERVNDVAQRALIFTNRSRSRNRRFARAIRAMRICARHWIPAAIANWRRYGENRAPTTFADASGQRRFQKCAADGAHWRQRGCEQRVGNPRACRDEGFGIRDSDSSRDQGLGIRDQRCHEYHACSALRRVSSDSLRPCSIFADGSTRTMPLGRRLPSAMFEGIEIPAGIN